MRTLPVCTLVAAMKTLMSWQARTAFSSKCRRSSSRSGSNFSGLRCHGVSVRWIRSAHSAPGESSRFQLPCRRSSGVRWIGLATDIAPSSPQKARSAARAPRPPPCDQPCSRMASFMAPALVPLTASNASLPSSIRASSTPQVKAPCEPPPCRARLTRLVELIWLFSLAGLRYLHRSVTQERRGRRHYGEGRGTRSVAKAPVDHSLDALAGPAHLLGPGLLHLPAVRRADDARARLVAQRHVRRAVGRPAGGRPVFDPGRRLDRPRARPHADDRGLAVRRGAPPGVV